MDVIQSILERLEDAHDVVSVCVTCRAWLDALPAIASLRFVHSNWEGYNRLPPEQIEMHIHRLVHQSTELVSLSIVMHPNHGGFHPISVMSWLSHTRETLCHLMYCVPILPNTYIDILGECNSNRLESLTLAFHTPNVTPMNVFERLHTVSLMTLDISALDLQTMIVGCPVLQSLTLSELMFDMGGAAPLEIPRLRSLTMDMMLFGLDIRRASNLEKLSITSCLINSRVFDAVSLEVHANYSSTATDLPFTVSELIREAYFYYRQ